MRSDIIIEHEHWQVVSLWDFIAERLIKAGLPTPKPGVNGTVLARVNQGRWIADCPNSGCGGAIVVSSQEPVFLCPACGSLENSGRWYRVRFPQDKALIEAQLLRRPARDGFYAINRNWEPGETVVGLRAENIAKGIG